MFSLRRKKEAKELADTIVDEWIRAVDSAPPPSTPSEYADIRQKEVDWLENRYDFNSLDGIRSIRASLNLPRPPFGGVTGDVDYYLRTKAAEHEKNDNIVLAVACLKKSNLIRMLKKGGCDKSSYYTLVRVLARTGFVEQAKSEKKLIDDFFGDEDIDINVGSSVNTSSEIFMARLYEQCADMRTDLVKMSVHRAACSECAKYQGRVFSLSGESKKFPSLPSTVHQFGGIHKGCSHTFYPFIYKVSDPELAYTLSVHPIKNWWHKRNIVAFSNRPFIDDRPAELIDKANQHIAAQKAKDEEARLRNENMIEVEAKRGADKRLYLLLQQKLPDICPKSLAGLRRMRTQNSKNYQKLKSRAAEIGIELP